MLGMGEAFSSTTQGPKDIWMLQNAIIDRFHTRHSIIHTYADARHDCGNFVGESVINDSESEGCTFSPWLAMQ